MAKWTSGDVGDQSGRVAVVTGANSGLGLVTATELAAAGARVIGTARSVEKAESARDSVLAKAPGAQLEPRVLDLAELGSVRRFVDELSADHERLHVLVNNAGVMMPPRRLTADGFELQFGTNHLGHFALTGLLLEQLAAGEDARVVTVTSIEHRPGKIDFDDLDAERHYSPRGNYQCSKFANAVFGLELDRQLREAGLSIKSLLAHPGYTATNLQSAGPTGLMKAGLAMTNRLLAQGPEDGARPQLRAATDPDAQGGEFFGPDGLGQLRGAPKLVKPVARARDPELGRRLWEVSEQLTDVRYLS